MRKILKQNNGAALAIVFILVTGVMVLLITLGNLAYQHWRAVRAINTKSNVYYVADYGMEKTVKNIETLIASAKTYANEKLRTSAITYTGDFDGDPATADETRTWNNISELSKDETLEGKLVGTEPLVSVIYKLAFETHYLTYMNGANGIDTINTSLNTAPNDYVEADPVRDFYYRTSFIKNGASYFHTEGTDKRFILKIQVDGKKDTAGTITFVRQVDADVGANPWGYNGDASVAVLKSEVHASPQWSSALASSGDITIQGGAVTVTGDIYVNGKEASFVNGQPQSGAAYGGLVVGKDGTPAQSGTLNVKGNIFSTNYVHTMTGNSHINVLPRSGAVDAAYNSEIENSIYGNVAAAGFANGDVVGENSNFLMRHNGEDPLYIEDPAIIGSYRLSQVNGEYCKYVRDTYMVQKKLGGFIYAVDLSTEKPDNDTAQQTVDVAGSVAMYDNLQTDANSTITIGHNFYGFKNGGASYNESSSIITNNLSGTISIGQRVYAGGTAYVTALNASNQPYQTGEAISLYKNYYNYRSNVAGKYPDNLTNFTETYTPMHYGPFDFLEFGNSMEQIRHVLGYNYNYSDVDMDVISQGGEKLDKGLILLNNGVYDSTDLGKSLTLSTKDMGYSEGVLIGQNFVGYAKSDGVDPDAAGGFVNHYKSSRSLNFISFERYIKNKYTTLMELKALKNDNGGMVTIRDLVDTTEFTAGDYTFGQDIADSDYAANYFISDEDITVTVPAAGKVTFTTTHGSTTFTCDVSPYNFIGLIMSTNGKVTIDCDSTNNFNMKGAIVSAINTAVSPTGIEFIGSGTKTVEYDVDVLLNIFRVPTDEGTLAKTLLTTKRGDIEMLWKAYNETDTTFKNKVDSMKNPADPELDTPDEVIEYIANTYEAYDNSTGHAGKFEYNDRFLLYADLSSSMGATGTNTKPYMIYRWKTVK